MVTKTEISRVFSYSTSAPGILGNRMVLPFEEKLDVPLFGVELELTSDEDTVDVIKAQEIPFFIIKSDTSIHGSKRNPYELVTAPMSFKAQIYYWSDWFSKINLEEYDTSLATTNGMHIHIGSNVFYDEEFENYTSSHHLRNFTWFFNDPRNQFFLMKFSDRTINNMEHYCRFSSPELPSNNKTLLKEYKNLFYNTHRMSAINLTNLNSGGKSTVEVRLFKGIVSITNLVKNMELVHSVIEFTRHNNFQNNTLKKYFEFLNKTPDNKYEVLKLTIQGLNPSFQMYRSNLINAIWNQSNQSLLPATFLKYCKEKNILIVNEYTVNLLNKWFARISNYREEDKKFFFLNKEGNTIEVRNSIGIVMTPLDEIVANKYKSKGIYKKLKNQKINPDQINLEELL